jgi:tRNA A-37 threonylcarbamoyl transferase component Bud32
MDNDWLADLLAEQQSRWLHGDRVSVETYLEQHPTLRDHDEMLILLIYREILLREELGEPIDLAEYQGRFPQYTDSLRRQLELHVALGGLMGSSGLPDTSSSLPDASDVSDLHLRTPTQEGEKTAPGGGLFHPPRTELVASPSAGVKHDPRGVSLPALPGYILLRKIKGGGQGVVFRAWQKDLGRVVALKVIRLENADDPRSRELFRNEAQAVARLEHPHVIRLYEYGETDEGPYFTMEFAEGGSLAQRLPTAQTPRRPLPPREAAVLLVTLARAMEYVHGRGIVHRDLKPANVLFAADGTPKVADFGLVKWLSRDTTLIGPGRVAGTLSYMAPEQTGGKREEVGAPADVYGLGAILYECLTGQPPFRHEGDPLAVLARLRSEPPLPPRQLEPAIPQDLETICLKCLEKKPEHRFRDAGQLADRLERYLRGEPIPERPPRWYQKTWRTALRRPVASVLLLFACLLLAAAPFAAHYLDPDRPRKEIRARLAEGKPFVFPNEGELPGPFRLLAGPPGMLSRAPRQKGFTADTHDFALLELIDDPGRDSYRFSVEIRHDGAAGLARIGPYISYLQQQDETGDRRLGLLAFTFADRGDRAFDRRGTPKAEVDPRFILCRLKNGDVHLHELPPLSPAHPFTPKAPVGHPGPWRKLAVEVRPTGIRVFWREGGTLRKIFDIPAEHLAREIETYKACLPAGDVHDFDNFPYVFTPRAGVGLLVIGCRAAIRNVTLEPLPPEE